MVITPGATEIPPSSHKQGFAHIVEYGLICIYAEMSKAKLPTFYNMNEIFMSVYLRTQESRF